MIQKWEWHEDSTRKWVLYNDPDESDSIVFKNDSTELFKITQAGEVQVTQRISHIGDTDTFINLTDDDINIQAGGVNFIDITQDSTNEITFKKKQRIFQAIYQLRYTNDYSQYHPQSPKNMRKKT